jgi:hypothetical protein
MIKNLGALAVGQLSERLVSGYYAHLAAIHVATDPRAIALAPETKPGFIVPVGFVKRKDGSEHAYHFNLFLAKARDDPNIKLDMERIWLSGAVLSVGDELSAHGYFDRAPELELLRHVRNGIAHGNRFRLDNPKSWLKYPAHNRLAWVRSDLKTEFEIEPAHHGIPVLFSYMGPADVLDLLLSVGQYLNRMGNGDPLRP